VCSLSPLGPVSLSVGISRGGSGGINIAPVICSPDETGSREGIEIVVQESDFGLPVSPLEFSSRCKVSVPDPDVSRTVTAAAVALYSGGEAVIMALDHTATVCRVLLSPESSRRS
jgi:hypothetical protein